MKQRIITGILLIIVFVPLIVLGGYSFTALITLVGAFASYELLSICETPKAKIYLYPVVTFYIIYSILFTKGELVPVLNIALFLIALLIFGIFDKSIDFPRLSYYFTASTLVALGLHMVYYLRNDLNLDYVLFLGIATLGADTGAYFVGRAIGKHKLNERLSPNKTIEGSIGGIIIGAALASIYAYFVKLPIDFIYIISFSCILATTGQVGDLTFSSIKRSFNVKDYSQIFPGHGGILDRFDSIIFNALVLGLLLNLVALG